MKTILTLVIIIIALFAAPLAVRAQEFVAAALNQIQPQYLQMLSLLQTRLNLLNQQLRVGFTPTQLVETRAELIAIRRTLIALTAITVGASNTN